MPNSIVVTAKPKERIYRRRSFLIATAAGEHKSHRWNDQSSLGAAPLVPVHVNFHVICHVEGTELLRGVFDLAARPLRTPPCLCPPSENPPFESRATYAPRQGWPNPILLFVRLGAAELHDCKCNAEKFALLRRILQGAKLSLVLYGKILDFIFKYVQYFVWIKVKHTLLA